MNRRDFLRTIAGTPAAFLVAKYGAPGRPSLEPCDWMLIRRIGEPDDTFRARAVSLIDRYGPPGRIFENAMLAGHVVF